MKTSKLANRQKQCNYHKLGYLRFNVQHPAALNTGYLHSIYSTVFHFPQFLLLEVPSVARFRFYTKHPLTPAPAVCSTTNTFIAIPYCACLRFDRFSSSHDFLALVSRSRSGAANWKNGKCVYTYNTKAA